MTKKALIVEDELELGQLLSEHLERWGYGATVLRAGKDVVSWVRANKPAVVLLDLMLPDADGLAICESLKLDGDTNLIPIVMITAQSGQQEKVRGLQVGANCYLTKPFSSDRLHQAINDALTWQEDLKKRGTHGEIRFQFASDTQYLEELNHLLGSLFQFSGLTSQQVKQLTTAVRELGTNAIEWGHRKQVDRIVTVDYQIDAAKITLHIKDTGPGFNPNHLPHAASPEDPTGHMMVRETLGLRDGGFGILIARGLVDDLEYNQAGNEVRLVKFFPPRLPAQQEKANSA
jgi:two-component system, OmpR family, response regulator